MTSRIETSRRNFEQFQKISRDLWDGLECMICAVREQHAFLKALPPGSQAARQPGRCRRSV